MRLAKLLVAALVVDAGDGCVHAHVLICRKETVICTSGRASTGLSTQFQSRRFNLTYAVIARIGLEL